MQYAKQVENKPKKLVINKESVRALANDTMKRDDVAVARFSPCIPCTTTR
jgi:hypothetical protein